MHVWRYLGRVHICVSSVCMCVPSVCMCASRRYLGHGEVLLDAADGVEERAFERERARARESASARARDLARMTAIK